MSTIPDERLALVFTCCHPALATEAQVALTLRMLGGLTITGFTLRLSRDGGDLADHLRNQDAKEQGKDTATDGNSPSLRIRVEHDEPTRDDEGTYEGQQEEVKLGGLFGGLLRVCQQ